MTDADAVLGLLTELRAAHGVRERLRVLRRGREVVTSLAPHERRELALAVAREAAPQWLPTLEERTGVDLSPGDLTLVLELVEGLDAQQIDRLGATLRDPDARREGATQAVRGAVEMARDTPEPTPDTTEAAPEAPEPAPEAPEVVAQAPAEQPSRPSLPAPPPPPPPPSAPPPPAPPEPMSSRPTPPDRPAEPPLARAVAAAVHDHDRLALLADAGADVWDLGPTGRAAVLDAVPDGWARRRALLRWVALDVITADEAPALVRRLGRRSDRAWVAASLVEAATLDVEDLAGLCDPRDARRLARRYATTGAGT